ncbi:MAG: cupin domain-containing protein [Planctomycetota bacterium]|jgi:quercetin dioxygenase-like cupin family protein
MGHEREKASVLEACLGKSQSLTDLVAYADDSIVSKTILDKPAGTVTLFAFDQEQKLSEHTSPYDAIVQVLDGVGGIIIDGETNNVCAGGIIIMPANVPHAVVAEEKFKMLLIMVRA